EAAHDRLAEDERGADRRESAEAAGIAGLEAPTFVRGGRVIPANEPRGGGREDRGQRQEQEREAQMRRRHQIGQPIDDREPAEHRLDQQQRDAAEGRTEHPGSVWCLPAHQPRGEPEHQHEAAGDQPVQVLPEYPARHLGEHGTEARGPVRAREAGLGRVNHAPEQKQGQRPSHGNLEGARMEDARRPAVGAHPAVAGAEAGSGSGSAGSAPRAACSRYVDMGTIPCSSHSNSPLRKRRATPYVRASSLSKSARKRSWILRRAARQYVSASAVAPCASPRSSSMRARTTTAVMTISSAPMSTMRPSTACRFSSAGPKRTIAWM